jgi:class 3 adenylate cyclase
MTDSGKPDDKQLHRSLAAIVITDVVNYSGMMSENEHLTLRLVQRDMDFLRKQCNRFEGEVLKSTGDGLLMTFDSAVNAVSCALRIQRGFAKAALSFPPEHRLQHRIGIHLGDIYLGNNDAMGDGVNVAARLQEKSEPGGVCISQTVYDVVKNRLGIQAVFLGPTELKNIREAVPIYKLLLEATESAGKGASGGLQFPGGRAALAAVGAGLAAVIILICIFAWPGNGEDEKPEPFDEDRSMARIHPESDDPHGDHRTGGYRPERHDPEDDPERRPGDEKRWKTLMPVLYPEKDGIGRWEMTPRGLVGFPDVKKDDSPTRFRLPVEIRGSYEIEIMFESMKEATVALVLCAGDRMIAAVVGGPDGKGGLHELHQDPFTENETTSDKARLEPNREHTLHALVKLHPEDRTTIVVSLDGKMIVDWTGPAKDLTMPDEWALDRKDCPGIGVHRHNVLFRNIRIRPVEGEGQVNILEEPRKSGRRFPILPGGRGGRRRPIFNRLRPESTQP